jgi:hypothetical protein
MASKDEVVQYLKDFSIKYKTFGLFFRDERKKNTKALLDLEITPFQRGRIIEETPPWIIVKDHLKIPYITFLIRGFLERRTKSKNSISRFPWVRPIQGLSAFLFT